jgi:flavin reductase (DIM6/NTAB) family NADH-FMN oxidoreductase RutF
MTTLVPQGGFPAAPTSFEDIPLGEVYRLIEPGPVVLLTTTRDHLANVMTMSWHMMVDFSPPLIACVVAGCLSSEAMDETGECVIAIPPVAIAGAVVAIGNASGRRIDKFAEYGLTPLRASTVGAPLVAECFVNLECRVVDATLAETYGLRILEVVKAWRDPAQRDAKTIHHHGFGDFVVDGRKLHLPSKMP